LAGSVLFELPGDSVLSAYRRPDHIGSGTHTQVAKKVGRSLIATSGERQNSLLPAFLRALDDANFYLLSRTRESVLIGAVDTEPLHAANPQGGEPLYNCRVLKMNIDGFDSYGDSEIQIAQGTYLDDISYEGCTVVLERDWPAEGNEEFDPLRIEIKLCKPNPGSYLEFRVTAIDEAQELRSALSDLEMRGAARWSDIVCS
jgi:hypothetical protein